MVFHDFNNRSWLLHLRDKLELSKGAYTLYSSVSQYTHPNCVVFKKRKKKKEK